MPRRRGGLVGVLWRAFRKSRYKPRLRKGSYNTGIELKTKAVLDALRITYRQQEYFRGIGFADFYLPRARLVIECDGLHWHTLPGRPEHDAWRDAQLRKRGVRVLRLPEKLINTNLPAVRRKIIRAL